MTQGIDQIAKWHFGTWQTLPSQCGNINGVCAKVLFKTVCAIPGMNYLWVLPPHSVLFSNDFFQGLHLDLQFKFKAPKWQHETLQTGMTEVVQQ